jgi:hypothetical protein
VCPRLRDQARRARLVVGCRRRNSCTVSYRVPSVERPGRRARLVVGRRRRNSCTVTVRTVPRSSVAAISTGEAPVAQSPSRTLPRRSVEPPLDRGGISRQSAGHRTLPRRSVEPPLDRGGISRQQPDIGLCREARSNRHSTGEAPVASRRTSPLCRDTRSSRHSTEEASVASSRTSQFAEKLGQAATRPGRHRSSTVGHRSLPRSSVEPPLDRGGISRQPSDPALRCEARSSCHSTGDTSVVNRRAPDFTSVLQSSCT